MVFWKKKKSSGNKSMYLESSRGKKTASQGRTKLSFSFTLITIVYGNYPRCLFTLNLVLVFLAATYLSWVVRCCSKGRLKAKNSGDPTSCNSDDLSRRRFQTPLDRLVCRHAERICCVKEMQKLSCQSGKYEAT